MLLSEYDFKSTFPSKGFLDVTETAENFNTKEFDEYVNNNLIDELGKMHIRYIYDAKDGSYRHIVFTTDLKNIYLRNKKNNLCKNILISAKTNPVLLHYQPVFHAVHMDL